MKTKELIESHKIPCGPMSVSVNGVCRRRLRDSMDSILDRLTKEVHPEGVDEETIEIDDIEIIEEKDPEESREDKKSRMLEEGKLKAEVKAEVEKYKDKLMGNSKMLQDRSGKIAKR
jgi:hypothetical protein